MKSILGAAARTRPDHCCTVLKSGGDSGQVTGVLSRASLACVDAPTTLVYETTLRVRHSNEDNISDADLQKYLGIESAEK